jgi:hypothetical protein
MSITLEYLPEPKLQFGHFFEHEDAKTGLAEFGPFGKNVDGLHPPYIKVGFVGTRETISGCKEWIEDCSDRIESQNVGRANRRPTSGPVDLLIEAQHEESQNIRYEKILNRDFVGMNAESPFNCCFQMNERWEKPLLGDEIADILRIDDKQKRIWTLVDMFESGIRTLAETPPSPHIVILALTPQIVEHAHSVQVSGNFYLNLRRAIKARSMKWGLPIQLLQRRTILGTGPELQEKATRAWNFCTAQYYKADGVPWRPLTLERDVCFAGISFYVAREVNEQISMRGSVAQAFDYRGQGLVLRGDPFQWDEQKMGRSLDFDTLNWPTVML